MNTETLVSIGLTKSQAKAYIALVQNGSLTPPELAKKNNETRTNAYKLLDRLVELELATKSEDTKKLIYRVSNPVALETLAKKNRNQALEQENRIKQSMPTLLNFFYTYSEQPGVRFFQGKEGIKQIFDDMLRTRQNIYLIRSPSDDKFYDIEFFNKFRAQRAKLGITTYALTPKYLPAIDRTKESADEVNKFLRTWLPVDSYTGSVEWDVYGNKVAIISYGEEAIGMIIESPQIAESMRQLFHLLQISYSNTS
jgi:sugar-specific transcriptional regulator TrmB